MGSACCVVVVTRPGGLSFLCVASYSHFLDKSRHRGTTDFYDLLGIFIRNAGPVFIAFFGFRSIGRKRLLYEEYNHKQRVMTLFDSFRKETDESKISEHKKRLLKIALDTVEEKPRSIYYDIEKKGLFDILSGIFSKNDSSKSDSSKNDPKSGEK